MMNEISLEQCYALLELDPGVSIEEIDAAYAKKGLEKIRQGAKQEKALLKVAYEKLKGHTYQTAQADCSTDSVTELLQRITTEPFHVKIQAETVQIFLKTNLKQEYADQLYSSLCELSDIKTIAIYGMRSTKLVAWKKQFDLNTISQNDRDPYSFKNRYILLLAFPFSMSVAILLQSTGIAKILFLPLQIWVHEFGHATVAWFSGRRAIPLPFGWTNISLERSSHYQYLQCFRKCLFDHSLESLHTFLNQTSPMDSRSHHQ